MPMKKSKGHNPFKLINKVDELPPELKREVMGTIKVAHLASDIGRLFTVDMARTAGKLINPDSSDVSND